jgi:cellulose synthase/poly-beta-1,6-N-acetylglucosamine synthase-like glycosyltransferase
MIFIEYIFWICLGLVFYTYLIYPFILMGISRVVFTQKKNQRPNSEVTVSLIFAAYNEESVLPQKIQNCYELNYPSDKFEILIGSDGSRDRTAEILNEHFESSNIKAFIFEENRGKAAVLNDLVDKSKSDILIFCDANTILLPNAINQMVQSFEDPQVGCVSGRLILQDSGATSLGEGESFYWNIETEIKKIEGQIGSVIGSNGALYAIRRELYTPIPREKRIMDDFFVSICSLLQGYKNIYNSKAIGMETISKSPMGEYQRKIRIGEANYNYLLKFLGLLSLKNPKVAFCFFSHKLLRWFAPHFLILILLMNAVLVMSEFVMNQPYIYFVLMALQILFYSLAWGGYKLTLVHKKSIFFTIPFYFTSIHWALLLGFKNSIWSNKKQSGGGWERIAREE